MLSMQRRHGRPGWKICHAIHDSAPRRHAKLTLRRHEGKHLERRAWADIRSDRSSLFTFTMVYEGNLQRILLVAPLFGCLGLFLLKYVGRAAKSRKHLPYPPGPKALPILGNLFDFPVEYPWLALDQLSRKHGAPLFFLYSLTGYA